MRRDISFIFILLSSVFCTFNAHADEKYSVVLERSRQLSPYEAINMLTDYQYWHPEFPGVYYQLGNLYYDLLPSRDPLHHYTELSLLLYQSRLFYGNCLHIGKEQKLLGWQYPEIANGQKRIEYAQLENYIRPRLEDIKHRQTACDSIHNTFIRMVERYNGCQALFEAFLTQYTREKTAHLQLQDEQRSLLTQLQRKADSLDLDILAYQKALGLQTIENYSPVFRKEEIVLYRLDGLTHTDFLQNDIALWDYSNWVARFLKEQKEVYEQLYADIQREYTQLLQQTASYTAGNTISGHYDRTLVGRCDRLEVVSPQIDSIQQMQRFIQHGAAEQLIAGSPAPQSIREMVPLLLIAKENHSATPDSAQTLIVMHIIQIAHPLQFQQQPFYTHPVSGETIRYTSENGEKVHSLLPDDKNYRCVTTTEQETKVICLDREMEIQRTALLLTDEKPLVFTKIPGNKWVLITDKDLHFID